ncbi:hypothetical protein JCM3775_003000 [Rhodotorula graminis]
MSSSTASPPTASPATALPPVAPAPASPQDLARQLASFRVQPPASESPANPTERDVVEREGQVDEEEWLLKTIAFPPLPPTPLEASPDDGDVSHHHGFGTDERLRVRVVCQNANGPCSLIALCNILILRGDLDVAPGRTSVTYSYLSNLLADYFLRASSSSAATPSGHELSLEAALSILPQTRYGLNLNPRFDRIDGFASPPSSSSSAAATSSGELALFALARIPLLHGWLADPAEPEAYDALVGEEGCRDYDTALERVVEGAEVAGGAGRLDVREEELSDEEMVREAELRSGWTEEQARKVRRAYLINTFLSSTSTQLTYPGLSALCTSPSLLPPSGLAALFRNSHLSVLYRRPTLPSTSSTSASTSGPELFTLVTDAAFAREEGIVWESLEDVDGAECAFFDAALRRSSVRGGDWVGSGGSSGGGDHSRNRDERVGRDEGVHDAADIALAQQLQAEEDAHERRLVERSRAEDAARSSARPSSPTSTPLAPPTPSSAPAERVRVDESSAPPPPRRGGAEASGRKLSRRSAGSAEGRKKEDKCLVM